MAITYYGRIGSATAVQGGNALAITVGVSGVPAGTLVLLRTGRSATSSTTTVSDAKGNTYTLATNGSQVGEQRIYYSYITTALVSGDNITVIYGSTFGDKVIVADGFSGLFSDFTVVASTSTNNLSNSPSDSGTPGASGQLVVGSLWWATNLALTQDTDTTDGSWNSLTEVDESTTRRLGGAYKIVTGTAAQTYNPTFGSSANWVESLLIFGPGVGLHTLGSASAAIGLDGSATLSSFVGFRLLDGSLTASLSPSGSLRVIDALLTGSTAVGLTGSASLTTPSPTPFDLGTASTTIGLGMTGALYTPRFYHVATSGNDTTGTGTLSNPWQTIKFALQQLAAGDTLSVHGGTYTENVELAFIEIVQATAQRPINVRAYNSTPVTIAGVVYIEKPNWWTFSGINVDGSTYDGSTSRFSVVRLLGGNRWRWTGSVIRGGLSRYSQLFYVSDGATNYRIDHNIIHDGPTADLLRIMRGDIGTVEYNLIHDSGGGFGVKIGSDKRSDVTPNTLMLRYNTVAGCSKGPVLVSKGTRYTTITKNILADGPVTTWDLTGISNEVTDNYGTVNTSSAGLTDAGDNIATPAQLDARYVPQLAAIRVAGVYQYGHLYGLSSATAFNQDTAGYQYLDATVALELDLASAMTTPYALLDGNVAVGLDIMASGYNAETGDGEPGFGLSTQGYPRHWANIREGDYLAMHLPYAGIGGSSPLVRLMKRTYATGEPFETMDLQYIAMQAEPRRTTAVGSANPRVRSDSLPAILKSATKTTTNTGQPIIKRA